MKVRKRSLFTVFYLFIAYLVWLWLHLYFEDAYLVTEQDIFIVSWAGIVIAASWFWIWKKVTGKFLTLFNIFLLFFILFNFGQCILWALNIHVEGEIGDGLLYGVVGCSKTTIVQTQLLFIISFITLNGGALIAYKGEVKDIHFDNNTIESKNSQLAYSSLFYTAILLSMIAIPVALYSVIENYAIAQAHGYKSLYYGNFANRASGLREIATGLFVPCLFGLLIGSQYKKGVVRFVYAIYLLYSVICLLSGDRGMWIGNIPVFFYLHNLYYKKTKKGVVAFYIIVGVIGLWVLDVIVSLRNVGISFEAVLQKLQIPEENAYVEMLKEFGNSMSVTAVVLGENVQFPYGNTYLMSLPTVFSTGLYNSLFNQKYVQLYTWFSADFLHIDYGADFTMIGEAVLNAGVYFAPLIMFATGMLMSKLSFLNLHRKESPLLACLCVSCFAKTLLWPRTTFWATLNACCYMLVIITFVYWAIHSLLRKNGTRFFGKN